MKLIPIFILLLVAASLAAQQTPSLNVPTGVIAVDFSAAPVVYTNAGPGLFRSVDEGFNWTPVYFRPAGQRQPLIYQVLVDYSNTTTLYAATDADDGGVWRTTDAGATWTIANNGLPTGGVTVAPLFILPGPNPAIYVKAGDGFYKTTDRGDNWTLLGSLPASSAVLSVSVADPRLMFSAARNAVYRSRDEGATWEIASALPLASGSEVVAVLSVPGDPSIVLASAFGTGAGMGLYRSTDQGTNFARVVNSQATTLFFDIFGRPHLYATAFECGCVDRSFNNGATWGRATINSAAGGARIAFDPRNALNLWASTGAGVSRTMDFGGTWLARPGTVRPTLTAVSPLEFALPPGSEGRVTFPLRVLETDRWTLPLAGATSGEPWLTVSGVSGTTPATASARVSAQGLAAGSYTSTIRVTSGPAANSPLEVPVRVTVAPREPEYGYTASTYAGFGQTGTFGDDGPAVRAAFGNPDSVAVDAAGNLFLSDPTNNAIRRVSPDGIIRRAAGNGQVGSAGDGNEAVLASLRGPRGLAAGPDGSLYIADAGNGRIRRVASGFISTVAQNLPRSHGLAVDSQGNLYVAFPSDHVVVRVTPNGTATRFAGIGQGGFRGDGGLANLARLAGPTDVAVDRVTGNIYISDTENHRIRVVTPDGRIRTFAGNGNAGFQGDGDAATSVALNRPQGLATDAAGNLYIADTGNNLVRVATAAGRVRTVGGTLNSGFSGDSGPALSAQFRQPVDVAVDSRGNLYVADDADVRIRKLSVPVIPQPGSLVGPSVRIAPGGFFSIFGAGLASSTVAADSTPYPAALGGVSVTVNGRDARLQYVSATQINGQLPSATEPGTARFRITVNGVAGPELPVEVGAAAPAILVFGANRAVATHLDATVNTAENAAAQESVITVYLTGIGLTDNPVADGQAAPVEPLSRAVLPVEATVGGQPAEVLFVGLAPGYVALAQANLKLPRLEPGDHAVVIKVGTATSNAPVVTVAP